MLTHIVTGFQIASFFVGVFCFTSLQIRGLRGLVLYIGLCSLLDLSYDWLPALSGAPFRAIYCFLIPLEYAVYGLLFWGDISPKVRQWLLISQAGVSLFSLYQLLFHLTERTAATNVFLVMSMLTIGLVLIYFYSILQTNRGLTISREPIFWIATGLLFFLSGNIVATGFYHKLRANPDTAAMARNLYLLNYVLSILKSTLFSIAFVIAARKPQHG